MKTRLLDLRSVLGQIITFFSRFMSEANTNYVIKDCIVSLQRRVGGTSQQRLTPEESEVMLVINADMAQIRDVCVMVDRTKESTHRPLKHHMEHVELEKKVTQTTNGKVSKMSAIERLFIEYIYWLRKLNLFLVKN